MSRDLVVVVKVIIVRKVEIYEMVVDGYDSLVDLEVGRVVGEGLDVDILLFGVEVESFEGMMLVEKFDLVDVLVIIVVVGIGVIFGVFVGYGRI